MPSHWCSLKSAAVPVSKHTRKKDNRKTWHPPCLNAPHFLRVSKYLQFGNNQACFSFSQLRAAVVYLLCHFPMYFKSYQNPEKSRHLFKTHMHQYGFGCSNLYTCTAGDDYPAFTSADSGLWNKTRADKIRKQRKHKQKLKKAIEHAINSGSGKS